MSKVDLEERILRAIMDAGDGGVLQRDLWKRLGIDSKRGGKIAARLEKRGLIRRDPEFYKGRVTYRLFTMRKLSSIEPMRDVPCLTCPNIDRCNVSGAVSPLTCKILTDWLLT